MDPITIISRYPDQEACIEHLERVRWGNRPACPKCDSSKVAPKADGARRGRWNCHACHTSFNVLSGTMFENTKVPLQKWFLAIGLMLNPNNRLSSYQLSRELRLTQPTALSMQQRIRDQMSTKHGQSMLRDIVTAHETDATA